MAQSASGKGDVKSFAAGDTLASFRVVTFGGASTTGIFVDPWATSTSHVLGVTLGPASFTGEAIDVLLAAPTAKMSCLLSVSSGALVGPATAGAGQIVERGNPATVTTRLVNVIGIALEAGDTNSVIEVLMNVHNQHADVA